ncbi:conserved protein of unknown function [Nitrospira defluvii]|jgi:hypothetical protein|uniref:Uncharacterized protein n=1 Tax=Nitrospira defluvii TaxID=330214 RepID=D8P971_9BACT|nr:conserved protein of unknown function [Nitrospira defluvii]
METLEEFRDEILAQVTSDDKEVLADYLKHFHAHLGKFSESMAGALLNWKRLDSSLKNDERRSYISALVYTRITLQILSMKLLLAGYTVAAGNLFRQVIETLSLALLCSGKHLGTLDRFMEEKYSTQDAIRDVIRYSKQLGLKGNGVRQLGKLQKFYSQYSHPTHLTIAIGISFRTKAAYFGGSFDELKLDAYRKEVKVRVGLANDLPNLIDHLRKNIAEW